MNELSRFVQSSLAKAYDFDGDSVLQNSLKACRQRIERIGDKIKTPDTKAKRLVERLIWPFKEEEVLRLMDSLRRYRSTFKFAAEIQGYQVLLKNSDDTKKTVLGMQRLENQTAEFCAQQGIVAEENSRKLEQLAAVLELLPLLERTSDEVREVSSAVRLQEMREQERRKSEILEWLCPLKDLHKATDLQSHRAPGTGQWFLDTAEFGSWLRGEVQDLICVGGPGVGKSVLCTRVYDSLVERHRGNDDVRVCHYYFNYSEQDLRNDVHLIRSILRQICVQSPILPAALSEFYQKTRDVEKDRTWFRALQRVLQRVVATQSKVLLVLDALDECHAVSQRPAVLQAIRTIREEYAGMQIIMTTRPHIDFDPQQLTNTTTNPATVVITASEDDLRLFLTRTIETYPDFDSLFDAKLKKEVLDRLLESANGLFLLPALHIQHIMEQPSKADVRRALASLSNNLTDVFTTTIARIQSLPTRWKEIAFQTLMWISHAKRPLTMIELQHALVVREDDTDFDEDALISQRRILDYCNGLVEYEHDSGIVHLVHYTLEEYLVAHDHNLFRDAELIILRTCLKYMTLSSLQGILQQTRVGTQEILRKMAFGNYACSHWGYHAGKVNLQLYADLVLPILSSSDTLMVVAKVRDANTADQRAYNDRIWQWARASNGGGGISLAAGFGLTELVRYLIEQQKEPNLTARNVHGSAALHEASLHGYEVTAELLIAHGADIHEANKGKSTPFYLAVAYGKLGMAKVLLKYGYKQLDQHCRGGYTALHKAVELDSEEMVQFLLDSNALIGANDDKNNTPLHVAALRGSLVITKTLIEAGAFVSAQNLLGETPLDLAATAGHASVVDYLLQKDADVSHRANDQWTALHRAARGGHVDTVVSLLEYGADLLSVDTKGSIPLHHAARAGHVETIQQLLDYAVYYREQQLLQSDNSGSRARTVAFFCANYDVYKVLRSLEWQIVGPPGGENNITLAIEEGDKQLIQDLLQKGSLNLDAVDEDGQPPLHVAVQEQQIEIAEMLLEAGASIEQTGYHGWRCIHIAASLGNLEVVEWCLQRGADVNTQTSTGQQAIHKAGEYTPVPDTIPSKAWADELQQRPPDPLPPFGASLRQERRLSPAMAVA